MNNTTTSRTISNAPPEHPALNFNFLRQEGIKYIQQLAGEVWTDYNTHDPGITILDQLCYALTDLSYRINYDMQDLLAEKGGNAYKSLFSPARILTVNPVTILDIRKVIIDVPGVKNAWVEKQTRPRPEVYYNPENKTLNLSDPGAPAELLPIKGLYRVLIEKQESTSLSTEILQGVTRRLHACRSLGEDFAEIKILEAQLVSLSGTIEVGEVVDINRFAAHILFRVAIFISPQIRFFTLEALLQKGKSIAEIFDGPALAHGFLDDEELMKYGRKTELHTSDMIREMMDEPGVRAVNQIALTAGSGAKQNWRLILDKEKTPQLDRDTTLQNLTFIKNGLALSLDKEKVERFFIALREANTYLPLAEKERDIIPEVRSPRNLGAYYSIQNHFPQAFGIGEMGLPESSPARRVAQARQLKAYLLFFEQILADYFEQLAHTKDLFSFYNDAPATYFHQFLPGAVPGAQEVLSGPDPEEQKAKLAGFTEDLPAAQERKNRFLDHLIARFSEDLTDYSLLLYDQMIQEALNPKTKPAAPGQETATAGKLVQDKLNFLKDYPAISQDRGKAFNYKAESWDTANVSGLEKRIAAKLGIPNCHRRSLAETDEEGFHLLEHILLRPSPEDLSGFIEYLVPRYISGFADAGGGYVACYSPEHGLQAGERIQIRGSQGYDGTYVVGQVLADSFQVKADFGGPGMEALQNDPPGQPTASWIRTVFDTRILLLTKPVTGFAPAGDHHTLCQAPGHNLEKEELVEILGTQNYNGIYKVLNPTQQAFEIDKPFVDTAETQGRWISTSQNKDPYSLQLTFIFPDRPEPGRSQDRFQNENFRAFMENTIREETPVHLTVYIRWLSRAEMGQFEEAFKIFLAQLRD